jgi:hypothetical protein
MNKTPLVISRGRHLSVRHRIFVAGFRRGLTRGMAESRELFQEELRQNRQEYREELTALSKELVDLKTDFSKLAVLHHRNMLERAVQNAIDEKSQHPGMLMN